MTSTTLTKGRTGRRALLVVLLSGVVALAGAAGVTAAPADVPAANDDFTAATTVVAPYREEVNTAFATVEVGEPTSTCETEPAVRTAWWTWTPRASGTYVVTTATTDPALAATTSSLAVWTGSTLGQLTEVDCATTTGSALYRTDRDDLRVDGAASLELGVTAGRTYQVQVATPIGGPLQLEVVDPTPPINDQLDAAVPLHAQALPYVLDWYGGALTNEPGEPEDLCSDAGSAGMWFTIDVDAVTTFVLDGSFSLGDQTVEVFAGAPTGDPVRCEDVDARAWYGGSQGEVVILEAQPEEPLWIRVNEYDDSSLGQNRLTVTTLQQPANDAFASATVVSSLPFEDEVELGAASDGNNEPDCPAETFENVWYAWTAPELPEAARLRVSTLGSPMDTSVAVYTRDTGETVQLRGCANDVGITWQEDASFPVASGETYFVRLATRTPTLTAGTGWQARVSLSLLSDGGVPTNDEPADATVVGALPWTATSTMFTSPVPSRSACGGAGLPDLWYRFTAPVAGDYWVSTVGSTPNSTLGIFETDSDESPTPVECVGDSDRLLAASYLLEDLKAGESRYLAVSGVDRTELGSFRLTVTGGAALAGTVTREDGSALPGRCIAVRRDDTELRATRSGTDGRWELAGFPEGTALTVVIDDCAGAPDTHDGRQLAVTTGATGTTRRVDVALNRPPRASDDRATTVSGRAVVIDVVANDIDPDGDVLVAVGATSPSNGSVTCAEACRYVPDDEFAGVDQFTYRAADEAGSSSPATVTVTVGEPDPGDGDPGDGDPGDGDPGDGDPGDGDPGDGDPGDGDPGDGDPGDGDPDAVPASARLAGSDRIDTAIRISQRTRPDGGANRVVLARADQYPDALAGGPLAAALDAPLLLTPSDGLAPAVVTELARLGATSVTLLGGTAALSEQVQADLVDAGVAPTAQQRLAGGDRFATAVAVAEELADVAGPAARAWIVEGVDPDPARGWPDAVAAGPAAATAGEPILLTATEALPSTTADAVGALGLDEVVIVGGPVAVSAEVSDALASFADVRRIAGGDRYATAVAVAATYRPPAGTGFVAWLATGRNFPDALAAGPAVVAEDGVLLLVDGSDPAGAGATLDWLDDASDDVVARVLVGGTGAIGDDVADAIDARLR